MRSLRPAEPSATSTTMGSTVASDVAIHPCNAQQSTSLIDPGTRSNLRHQTNPSQTSPNEHPKEPMPSTPKGGKPESRTVRSKTGIRRQASFRPQTRHLTPFQLGSLALEIVRLNMLPELRAARRLLHMYLGRQGPETYASRVSISDMTRELGWAHSLGQFWLGLIFPLHPTLLFRKQAGSSPMACGRLQLKDLLATSNARVRMTTGEGRWSARRSVWLVSERGLWWQRGGGARLTFDRTSLVRSFCAPLIRPSSSIAPALMLRCSCSFIHTPCPAD